MTSTFSTFMTDIIKTKYIKSVNKKEIYGNENRLKVFFEI